MKKDELRVRVSTLEKQLALSDRVKDRAQQALRDLQDLHASNPAEWELRLEVMVSEEGEKARLLGRQYGRASRTIAEQRGTIARLRMELANTRQHVERSRDAATVAAAERHGDEIGQRDRTAAIDTAQRVLRDHVTSTVSTDTGELDVHCFCGWKGSALEAHRRHVAEQLAAVGALGDTEPSPVDADTERRLRAGRISTFILTHRMHERDPRADACACGWTPASDVKRGEWRSAHLRHIFEQIEAAEIES